MKLKYSEIKEYRAKILISQQGRCRLCENVIVDDAVLDHDHKTGRIRSVLHRGCNALLGKIENNLPRNRISKDQLRVIARNLLGYLEQEYEDIVHPTYRTPEERKMRAYKKKKTKTPGKKY